MRATVMRTLVMVAIVMTLSLLIACSNSKPKAEGPGFIASYGTKNESVYYHHYMAGLGEMDRQDPAFASRTDSGRPWNWSMGGTEGAAPDPRGLPEWIEFRWREIPYAWESSKFDNDEWKKK